MSRIPYTVQAALVNATHPRLIEPERFIGVDPSGYQLVVRVRNGILRCPVDIYNSVVSAITPDAVDADVVADIPTVTDLTIKASTSSCIMNRAFPPSYNRPKILLMDTGKGYRYRSFFNTLLDEDYNPLFMFLTESAINGSYKKNIFLVSPEVFGRTDIMSKYVVRTLIPNMQESLNVDTVISSSIKAFIHKVEAPNDQEFNEEINGIIRIKGNESEGILQGLDQSDTLW